MCCVFWLKLLKICNKMSLTGIIKNTFHSRYIQRICKELIPHINITGQFKNVYGF